MKQFAVVARDLADLDKVLASDFGIDASAGLKERIKAGSVQCAWESAKARTSKTLEAEGEAMARGVPKDLPSTDYQAMREAFEHRYGVERRPQTPREVLLGIKARSGREE